MESQYSFNLRFLVTENDKHFLGLYWPLVFLNTEPSIQLISLFLVCDLEWVFFCLFVLILSLS